MLIGLGLMLLALEMVVQASGPMLSSPIIKAMLTSMNSDIVMELFMGCILAVMAYSSLAIVLLISAMAASNVVPLDVALGLVLGANLGSGLLAIMTTAKSSVEVRQVTVGNMVFKVLGVIIMTPFIGAWMKYVQPLLPNVAQSVVLFHLAYNIIISVGFIGFTQWVADLMTKVLPKPVDDKPRRPQHLDPSALSTPSLAISCAAREALYQADVVETMLTGMLDVIQKNDEQQAERIRKMDDEVDQLYSAIKYYLTKISREALGEEESKRWADIISFTINMEQIGDIIERVLLDIEDKKIKKNRQFSVAGMDEINELHARLIDNLRLAMSVFLNGNVRDAQKLLEEKMRFRDLEHAYAVAHLERLSENTVQSIETSSLHIDLTSELKRINSLLCSVAYPILESAGALAPTRLRSVSERA